MKLASSFSLAALIAVLLFCGLQPAHAGNFTGPYITYGVVQSNAHDVNGDDSSTGNTVTDSNPSPNGPVVFTLTGPVSFEHNYSNTYTGLTLDVLNLYVTYRWQPAYPGDAMPTDFSNSFITVTPDVTRIDAPGGHYGNDGAIECGFDGTATGDAGYGNEGASTTLTPTLVVGSGYVSTPALHISAGVYPATDGEQWGMGLRMAIIAGARLPITPAGGGGAN